MCPNSLVTENVTHPTVGPAGLCLTYLCLSPNAQSILRVTPTLGRAGKGLGLYCPGPISEECRSGMAPIPQIFSERLLYQAWCLERQKQGQEVHLIVRPRLPQPPVAFTFHQLFSDIPLCLPSPWSAAPHPFQELVQREMQVNSVNVYGELSVASGPGI